MLVLISMSLMASLLIVSCNPVRTLSSTKVYKELSVNMDNSSEKVTLAIGGTLTVTLKTVPSTYYQWNDNADISDQTIL